MERLWMTLDQIKVEYASNDYNPELLLQHLLHHVEASPASAPAGWKLVPFEPTDAVVVSGCRALGALYGQYGATEAYRAMLAAAPTTPASEDQNDAERFREGWTHACNALCMEIALWIERCPHCGMPAPKAPAMQEDKP